MMSVKEIIDAEEDGWYSAGGVLPFVEDAQRLLDNVKPLCL